MTEKRFELYDVGSGYFTYCGIEDNNEGDCFENMEQCCDKLNELHDENHIKLEIVDGFIFGMEDEKGIAPEDKEFQCRMNHTIRVLKRLKEDMLNPTEFKRLNELIE